MKLLKKLLGTRSRPDGVQIISEAAAAPPVVRYVNMMFWQMFQINIACLSLRANEPLPFVSERDAETPPLDNVLNRLKVMAGLNPVIYAQPMQGNIKVMMGGTDYQVHCQFDDSSEDRCEIRKERS